MSLHGRLKAKIGDPIVEQLTQGLSPDKIALTVAFGLAIAIFPVVGGTTILCFLAAWAFRLNVPIIQAINWSSYALQLLMILPFIRLGEKLFAAPRLPLSLEQIVAAAKADPFGSIGKLWTTTWHAVAAWALVTPLLIAVIYYAARPLCRSLARRAIAYRRSEADPVA